MKKFHCEFAQNVFDCAKMKRFLSRKTFRAVTSAENFGKELSHDDVENFAKGLRKWAMRNGVTRFTHWFQPLNNLTAGKRDSLSSVDEYGSAIVKFYGKQLQHGEGDASSFPNGGIRQTFEARGVTEWDCTSHAFIKDDCLFIPTTFRSFTGEALDKKTPLLRSCSALNKQALRLMKLAGWNFKKIFSVVGAEQEYFLIDKTKYLQRKDLQLSGRTLFGAAPSKGQQLNDHYYRPPNEKIVRYWQEVDNQLWKLGIVSKTEHREVAPNQFELAPCYATVNVACDQNQLIMQTLQEVAEKFDLVCLLHEKPFEKINGSGKHNNWSLLTDTGENLFEQGKHPQQQARFILLLACVLKAVEENQDLLRFSVSSAANDCRLGGFEAPPQTISVFLGNLHTAICEALCSGDWELGKNLLAQTDKSTDRNRTSPFAFTGNKFEFRMVGSSASLADCNTVLNTIMADAFQWFADNLETSENFWRDAQRLITQVWEQHGKIVFNGNNYSKQWQTEAKSRGLHNICNTAKAAECLAFSKNVQLFERHNVFSARELSALQQICWQNYVGTILVEADTFADIAQKQIAPSIRAYVLNLLQIAMYKQQQNIDNKMEITLCKQADNLLKKLCAETKKLQREAGVCRTLCCAQQAANFAANKLLVTMKNLRGFADNAEQLCPKNLWTIPTYDDLLF